MKRLATLPYSYRIKDFINKYRKPLMIQTTTYDIPKVQYDKDGRSYITVYGRIYKRIFYEAGVILNFSMHRMFEKAGTR